MGLEFALTRLVGLPACWGEAAGVGLEVLPKYMQMDVSTGLNTTYSIHLHVLGQYFQADLSSLSPTCWQTHEPWQREF